MHNDPDQTPLQQIENPRPQSTTSPQTQMQITPQKKRYWRFVFYVLPLIVTIVVGTSTQLSIRDACLALPTESIGECGAGWLQIFVIPITYLALFVSWVIILTGTIHLFVKLSRDRKDSEKSLFVITGVLLGIIGSAIGFLSSWAWISSIY